MQVNTRRKHYFARCEDEVEKNKTYTKREGNRPNRCERERGKTNDSRKKVHDEKKKERRNCQNDANGAKYVRGIAVALRNCFDW